MAAAVNFDEVYSAAMKDVKERIRIAQAIPTQLHGAPPHVAQEFMALQVRMATELLAVGCIAAYEAVVGKQLLGEWNASSILSRLEAVHADYFPIPIELSKGDDATNINVINPNPGGRYLTRRDLLDMYGRAGNLLHVGMLKTIMKQKPRSPTMAEMQHWFSRLHTLLNEHLIVRRDTHLICLFGPISSSTIETFAIASKRPPVS